MGFAFTFSFYQVPSAANKFCEGDLSFSLTSSLKYMSVSNREVSDKVFRSLYHETAVLDVFHDGYISMAFLLYHT